MIAAGVAFGMALAPMHVVTLIEGDPEELGSVPGDEVGFEFCKVDQICYPGRVRPYVKIRDEPVVLAYIQLVSTLGGKIVPLVSREGLPVVFPVFPSRFKLVNEVPDIKRNVVFVSDAVC
jgi:hypothetical protein